MISAVIYYKKAYPRNHVPPVDRASLGNTTHIVPHLNKKQ